MIAAYAGQRKDVEDDVWMTEIRRRAEVRIGELSRELDKAERGDGSLPTLPIRPHLRVDTGRATPEAFDCPMFSRVDGIYPIYVGHIKSSVALAALVAGEA